jgi:predicted PurR-regulated permease PerM
MHQTGRAYFTGLVKLAALDTIALGFGLWALGLPGAWLLALVAAILAWVPFVGSIAGCLLVVLVAATDFPHDPGMAYRAIALFVAVRLLDDFVFLPATVGKSLNLHPLVSVLMLFVGGAAAGVAGLALVLPLLACAFLLPGLSRGYRAAIFIVLAFTWVMAISTATRATWFAWVIGLAMVLPFARLQLWPLGAGRLWA